MFEPTLALSSSICRLRDFHSSCAFIFLYFALRSYNLRERQKKMLSIGPYPLLRRYFPGSEEVTHAGDQNLVATTVYSQDSFTFSEFPGKGGGECHRKCVAITYESVKKRCSRLAPIPCFAGTSPGSEEVTHAGNQHLVATTVYSQDSFTFSDSEEVTHTKGSASSSNHCVFPG